MQRLKVFNLCNAKWRDFAKPLVLLIAASTLIIALFFTSCATSRKTEAARQETFSQGTADSIVSVVIQKTVEVVPMSEVKMEIPTENLLKLPDKAEYRAKNGQASATVKIRNDTVYIDAACDSLQIMCEYYESKYNLYKNGYDELRSMQVDTSEKRSNPIKTVFISFFVGVVIGILLTIIVKLKFRIL